MMRVHVVRRVMRRILKVVMNKSIFFKELILEANIISFIKIKDGLKIKNQHCFI
jgi:hypothetical protein